MSQNRVARSGAPAGGVGVRQRQAELPRETPRAPVIAPQRQRTGRTQAQTGRGQTQARGAARPVRPVRPGGVVHPAGLSGARSGARTVGSRPLALTGLGVALALATASSLGALLDLLLVNGPAWALTALYVAACGYTAGKVRPSDWYTALVAPPLAFAASVILLAYLMPDTFGHSVLGLAAGTFELLATKAKALYLGASLTAVVLVVRRLRGFRARRARAL